MQLPSFSYHPNRRRCHILNNVSSVPSSFKDGFNDGAMHGTVRPRRLHSGSDAFPEGEGHWRVCRRAPDDYASAQRPQLPVLCKTWVSHFYSFFNPFCVKNRLLCSSTYNILFLFQFHSQPVVKFESVRKSKNYPLDFDLRYPMQKELFTNIEIETRNLWRTLKLVSH